MKESLKKVFTCDFCNKKYFVKHACETHESWCHRNPENFKPCMNGCKHLDREDVEIYYDTGFGEESFTAKCFVCNKKDKLMYPLSAERKGLDVKFNLPEHNQEPMPKECEHYEQESFGLWN